MKTTIPNPESHGAVLPSGDAPLVAGNMSLRHMPSVLFTMAVFCFLLLGAPAARADRSPTNCSGSGLGITLFTSIPDVHIGDVLRYSIYVFNGIPGSGRTVCDASSIQAFIVTPDGVTNAVSLLRTLLHQGEGDFYPDVVSYVVRAQDILPDGTVNATARDVGIIHQNDSNSEGGGYQEVNTEVNLPCIGITAFCIGSTGENGAITFFGTVTNCGNNTLVGVTVTNFHDAGFYTVLFPTNLARGQAANFTGTWVPLHPCSPSTATLTVRARDEFTSTPRTVTSFTTVTCQNVLTPGIQVTKACPVGPVSPGQMLTFSGSVSNTGNVTLTNIVVVNNQPASNTTVFTLASLAPGALANFTGSYLAPTNCSVADTLNATAFSRCGGAVSSAASATCPITTAPQIVVTASCPPTPILPGGSLTYSGTVRNAGDIPLTNVVVISDRPAANTTVYTVALLAPGASSNFTGTYAVPANACSVTTTFRATAKDICTTTTVTNTVSTTCTVTTAPAIAVSLACPVTPASTGGPITYTGTVSNSGNVTLINVYVVNNRPAVNTPVIGPITLLPNASASFTASFTAPSDSCSVTSTVTATGSDNCATTPVTNSASATCSLITTPSIAVTQDCPVIPAIPGALLTYTGTVRNAGNITLTNVVVLNNLSGASPIFTVATLTPGAVSNFTGSYLAPTNCFSTSTSTATGRSICGVAVTNTVSATCTILTAPQIVVTAVCPVTPVLPGGTLTYSGTVRNTGNITLTNVVVISDRPSANTTVFTVPSLAPGATANFTSSSTVPANVCSVATLFSGTAKDICTAAMVTNTVSTTCTVTTAPAIAVALACPVASTITGGPITYTGTVSNTGNVTLINVYVVNNQPTSNTPVIGPITLLPNASANFTASFTSPADACSVSSTVTATGSDNCTSARVTNTASATCVLITTPGIAVTKACPVSPVAMGSPLVFAGTVTNTGNITLTNVIVVNNQPAPNTRVFGPITLTPGAGTNFTGSYNAPFDACVVTDVLTASGNDKCTGSAVSRTASATCPLLTAPAIVVTQFCPPTPVLQGAILTYSGIVSNAGNITLTNIVVVNNWPAPNTVVFTAASLAPGASASFTGSYQVPLNCCVAWSTLQARGQGCDGVTVTDTDSGTCTVLTMPAIVVTKTCAPGILRPGDLLTYSGIVSNAGNIALVNVTVVNNQPGGATLLLGPLTLAPGEYYPYTASYVVPMDFCGTDTVTASGLDACSFAMIVNSVTTTCPVLTEAPRIAVSKRCPAQPTPHGGVLTFSGTVTNPGNVTLVNVYVVNNQPSNNTPVIGPITLAPGGFHNFTGSYIAPALCCEMTDTLTARGQDRCSASNVTATATAICPLLYTPGIALVQSCPPSPIAMGSLYAFNGYVTNTGDAILTNVLVFNGPAGQSAPLLGPIDLAPGESERYAGSQTAPFNTCAVTVTATARETCKGTWITNAANCPIATTPAIAITQNCPAGPAVPGALLTFAGSVSNAGNITLNNLVVTNSRTGNTPILTIAALAPGSSSNFTGSYTAPGTGSTTTSTSTARALSLCGSPVTNAASSTCLLVGSPGITVTKHCPPMPVAPGGTLVFSGTVANTGNVTLTNVFVVNNQPVPNTPVLGPITLAPGVMTNFTGSYTVPLNACSSADTLTSTGRDSSSGIAVTNTVTANCAFFTTPMIAITENCPPGPVSAGSTVLFNGWVSNPGNITLTNVQVFGGQPTSSTPLLGPITLAPGASAPYAGSYIATGGAFPVTNVTYVTNSGSVITTNVASVIATNNTPVVTTNVITPAFGTIDPVALTMTDRFAVVSNLHGLMFADQDMNWGPTLFYATRDAASGPDQFDTITPGGLIADRFSLVATNYVALTMAAPDVGHGAVNFYYLRNDGGSVSTFGVIKAAAASSSADLSPVLPNSGYKALAFAESDISGFGANLFYYLRETGGLTTLGTISVAGAMVVTDRYNLGTDMNFDAMVFVPGTVSTWGAAVLAYLRHDATGSIIGTIDPVTHVATDRLSLGTNFLDALTFTATDAGFGPNLFYYLRPERAILTTNIVTTYLTNAVITFTTNVVNTYLTNSVITFTPTNTVTATGMDLCQSRTVAAAANCLGPIAPASPPVPVDLPPVSFLGAPTVAHGFFSQTFLTENGVWYTVQYKNSLSDPTWTDLETVVGTGGTLLLTDVISTQQPGRFYRIIYTP